MQNTHTIALVGAPNCGKTVLFNALTGAKAKVANYPGVTVERKEGRLVSNKQLCIIDLPGTYGLRVTSPDEAVTRDALLGLIDNDKAPEALVVVADATNIRLSLRMILELKALNKPMIVALNMSDVAEKRGFKLNIQALSEALGVPVIKTIATKNSGTAELKQRLNELIFPEKNTETSKELSEKINHLDSEQLYIEVERILQQSVIEYPILPKWHIMLDKILMHRFWGMLILLVVLFTVFQAVFSWAEPIMGAIEEGIASFGDYIGSMLSDGLLKSLLVDGIIAGVGSVLVFLPQIIILFAFILLLEDSGYLPRAAFLFDKIMHRFGLSGRAFIPLLSSFACAIPAVMATRTIPNPRERLVTIAIAPLMTCSARLPIYALIIGAVIPHKTVLKLFNLQGITLFVLYLLGIMSGAAISLVLKKYAQKQGKTHEFPLLMELPTYRMPNFKALFLNLLERAKIFLQRAGTIIFALVVLLWFLSTFPAAPENATLPAIEYSFAGRIGQFMQPLFAPLGFTWQMCISLIPGMAAREVVIGALGTVYAVTGGNDELLSQSLRPIISTQWGLPTAFAFLTWYVYAPQCLAMLTVIKRETNSMKQTLWITGYLFTLAYILAALVHKLVEVLI